VAWVKGQSGNPSGSGAGRPRKGDDAPSVLAKALKKIAPGRDILAEKIAAGVLAGDYNFVKLAAEYRWGRPLQRTETDLAIKELPPVQVQLLTPAVVTVHQSTVTT
jgi:hypothetical protein